MSYEVKPGNIWGRLGQGLGQSLSQGLAEQIPKEADRFRLAQGLKELGKKKNNDVWENFTELAALPGSNPQITQSGTRLLEQRAQGNALKNLKGEKPANPFKKQETNGIENETGKKPSITTSTGVEATRKPYIPPTYNQIQARAGELLDQSPGLYNNDPQLALQAAKDEAMQEQAINQAQQGQRAGEQDVQNTITNGLREQQKNLGAILPGKVYSDIEDRAINSVKSIEEGGEGLTEQQAKKNYGEELDNISRDYKAVETIGGPKLLTKTPSGNREALDSVREGFKKRNDLENYADTLVSETGLSYPKAYYMAFKPSDIKELNNALKKIPQLPSEWNFATKPMTPEQRQKKTLEVSEQLAPLMGKEGSPLAIATELKSRNYDPNVWMNYLNNNRKKLGIDGRQGRELDKPRDFRSSIGDLWLFNWSGLDKLVEQE